MKIKNIDYEVVVRPMVYFQVHNDEHYKDVLLMFTNQAREKVEGIIKVKNYYYNNEISLIVDGERTVQALKKWFANYRDIDNVRVENVRVVELFGELDSTDDMDIEFICPNHDNFF